MRYSSFSYLIGEGFRNVFKNKKSTIASLIIMCATMFLFGIFFMVGANVNHITKTVEDQQGMVAFIKDTATEEKIKELGNNIRNLDYVNQATFRTKEDGLNQMKSWMKDRKGLLATYEGESNPFPASYVITLTDLTKADEVQKQIEAFDIVSEVQTRPETIQALINIAKGIKMISIVILVILILISVFIITNTIKLTVHARRKEISIMKYVGATNGFIRWPFMVEGMIIGIISALISMVVLGPTYNVAAEKIMEAMLDSSTTLLTFNQMFTVLLLVYLALGIGVGAIGSAISMRKYLEV
ncbi:MAG: permease-like cell division protein FtsX [Clostridia bacterium]|nr:permease-like cell division protein FtsX [Clostridia bacterium]